MKFARLTYQSFYSRKGQPRKSKGRKNLRSRRIAFETLEDRRLLSVTPELLKDINPAELESGPASLTNLNGTVYFSAGNSQSGRELWRSDGTAAGTVMVKDIRPGSLSSNPGPPTEFDGADYLSADDGVNGDELWKTDGTEA